MHNSKHDPVAMACAMGQPSYIAPVGGLESVCSSGSNSNVELAGTTLQAKVMADPCQILA